MACDTRSRDVFIYGWLLWFPILKMSWEIYLHLRQLAVVDKTLAIPKELADVITADSFKESRFYSIDRLQFRTFILVFELMYTLSTVGRFTLYTYWQAAMEFAEFLGFSDDNELAVSLAFVFHINYVLALIDIPISCYETFVIEKHYGFNNQTMKDFLWDRLLLFIVTQCLMLPMIACAITVIKYGGEHCFYILSISSTLSMIGLIYLQPIFITPLFYRIKPFPSGPLKQSFEDLACQYFFPVTELYLSEGSKKSEHSNAYLTGIFGSIRIVLFDTLLYKKDPVTGKESGMKDEEIFAVICHEMGHFKHNHMTFRIIILLFEIFTCCMVLDKVMSCELLYEAVGFPADVKPVLIGIFTVDLLLAPLSTVCNCLIRAFCRQCEYQADEFTVTLGNGEHLKKAMCILQKDNLSFPDHDWMFSNWYRTHPSFLERIRYIDSLQKTTQ